MTESAAGVGSAETDDTSLSDPVGSATIPSSAVSCSSTHLDKREEKEKRSFSRYVITF